MARTREHVIETLTRRIVPSVLPPDQFVERDQTERDYGVDLTLECFRDGHPTGSLLMLQLKGTDDPAPTDEARSIPFNMKVRSLIRAERFITPILLVWCPVQENSPAFWYVWLQEYIAVALDGKNPGWRRQKHVRIHIPTTNVVGRERKAWQQHLPHVADHPKRLAQFGQLSRIAHEARWAMNDPSKLAPVFEEALALDAIFGDHGWDWSKTQRAMVEKGLLACRIALRGIDPTDEELHAIGWFYENSPPQSVDDRWNALAIAGQHCAQLLSTACAIYFDVGIKRMNWEVVGGHTF
jgi:hypothetical protein